MPSACDSEASPPPHTHTCLRGHSRRLTRVPVALEKLEATALTGQQEGSSGPATAPVRTSGQAGAGQTGGVVRLTCAHVARFGPHTSASGCSSSSSHVGRSRSLQYARWGSEPKRGHSRGTASAPPLEFPCGGQEAPVSAAGGSRGGGGKGGLTATGEERAHLRVPGSPLHP